MSDIVEKLALAISPAELDPEDQVASLPRWKIEEAIEEIRRLRAELAREHADHRQTVDDAAALARQLAQRGEPVAWIKDTSLRALQRDEATVLAYPRDYLIRPAVPLYTAPPQRKPLGDEQIDNIGRSMFGVQYGNSDRDFARAVERAHGIGGDDERKV